MPTNLVRLKGACGGIASSRVHSGEEEEEEEEEEEDDNQGRECETWVTACKILIFIIISILVSMQQQKTKGCSSGIFRCPEAGSTSTRLGPNFRHELTRNREIEDGEEERRRRRRRRIECE